MTANLINTGPVDSRPHMPAYPLSILIGCAALDEVDAFNDLPDGFWRVVTRLVKKISVTTPFQAIFARRDTLARESGKSVETVGRALRWLEDEGFITRQQKARRGLRGSEAHLHPTPKLITALGFGQKTAKPKLLTPTEQNKTPIDVQEPNVSTTNLSTGNSIESAVKTDASVSALQVHSLLTKKQSEENVSKRQTAIIEGKVIPIDLVWMSSEKGLPATGILRLMKLASLAGQRLSDIVAVCKPALVSLGGKALFAYVRKLIGQDKDYSGILRKLTDDQVVIHQNQQDAALVEIKKREWCGQRYISRDQQRIWIVTNSGFIRRDDGQKNEAIIMDKRFVEAVMSGDLRRLAT